jgi:hypothetical protein
MSLVYITDGGFKRKKGRHIGATLSELFDRTIYLKDTRITLIVATALMFASAVALAAFGLAAFDFTTAFGLASAVTAAHRPRGRAAGVAVRAYAGHTGRRSTAARSSAACK